MNKPLRNFSLADVLGRIRELTPKNTASTVIAIHGGLERLRSEFAQANDKKRRYIAGRFEKLLAREADQRRRIFARSVLFLLSRRYADLVPVLHEARRFQAPLAERYATWFALFSLVFSHHRWLSARERLKADRQLRLFYRTLFEELRSRASTADAQMATFTPTENRVLIVTDQFLGETHAPTAAALRHAQVLAAQLGKDVAIYNSALPPRAILAPVQFAQYANFVARYGEFSAVDLGDGAQARFLQNAKRTLDVGWANDLARYVQDFSPAKVLSIGPGNLLADWLSQYVPTTALPTTANLPISEAGMLTGVRALSALEARALEGIGFDEARRAIIPRGISLPPKGEPVSLNDFGLPEDAFIAAIVGNRLDEELSEDFAQTMRRLLERVDKLAFAVAGVFDGRERWCARYTDIAGRLHFAGYQKDILGFLATADVYLNPPRQGGGSAAAYALAEGVPVLTLDGGDAGDIVGPDFVSADEDALIEACARFAEDPEHLSESRDAAAARWAEIGDFSRMTSAALDHARLRP